MKKTVLMLSLFLLSVPSLLLSNDFETGVVEYKKGDYQMALNLFNTSCKSGNKQGCYNLAVMYKHGQGIRPSRQKAQELFYKACDSNIKECRFNELNSDS